MSHPDLTLPDRAQAGVTAAGFYQRDRAVEGCRWWRLRGPRASPWRMLDRAGRAIPARGYAQPGLPQKPCLRGGAVPPWRGLPIPQRPKAEVAGYALRFLVVSHRVATVEPARFCDRLGWRVAVTERLAWLD